MAKAKGAGLLAQVKNLPPPTSLRGSESWFAKLKKEDPDLYAELETLVRQWLDADPETIRAFPSQSSLWSFLAGKDDERPIEKVVCPVERGQFARFVRLMARGEL